MFPKDILVLCLAADTVRKCTQMAVICKELFIIVLPYTSK